MRTTLTLDDDLVLQLKEQAHERDLPFKQVVNETIRQGLAMRTGPREPFRMTTSNMGVPEADLTKALQMSGQLEDNEIMRKLWQGR